MIALIILVLAGMLLGWFVFKPDHDAVTKYSRRNVPGLDEHLKSKRFREEAESLRQIVNHHRAMERKKKQKKKSETVLLRDALDALKRERDFAMGAAIVPNPDSDITYKDWIHVYGGEEENS